MDGKPVQPRGGQHLHGQRQLRHDLLRRLLVRRVDCLELVVQVGGALCHDARRQVRDEVRPDSRAVVIRDAQPRADRRQPLARPCDVPAGQTVGEQEEPHAVRLIPVGDLRRDGKRRVVDDHAAVGVFLALVVAAGVERTDDARTLRQLVPLERPRLDGLEDVVRREAVVRGVLGLELCHKRRVFLRFLRHADLPDVCQCFNRHEAPPRLGYKKTTGRAPWRLSC